jgi:RNA polymerase sigma-70 factor (ECF subfamily)
MSLESSVELIRRAQDGDAEALNQLLTRYLPRLRRWASGRLPMQVRELADTNDLVQDALIGSIRQLRQFEDRGEGALQAYLRQAVKNRIVDEVRRVQRRPPKDPLDPMLPDGGRSPLELAIGAEALDRYEAALAELTDTERQAVVARLELGYTYDEIAAIVNKPTGGAARVAITRAIAKLARLMAP